MRQLSLGREKTSHELNDAEILRTKKNPNSGGARVRVEGLISEGRNQCRDSSADKGGASSASAALHLRVREDSNLKSAARLVSFCHRFGHHKGL